MRLARWVGSGCAALAVWHTAEWEGASLTNGPDAVDGGGRHLISMLLLLAPVLLDERTNLKVHLSKGPLNARPALKASVPALAVGVPPLPETACCLRAASADCSAQPVPLLLHCSAPTPSGMPPPLAATVVSAVAAAVAAATDAPGLLHMPSRLGVLGNALAVLRGRPALAIARSVEVDLLLLLLPSCDRPNSLLSKTCGGPPATEAGPKPAAPSLLTSSPPTPPPTVPAAKVPEQQPTPPFWTGPGS